MSFILALDQGTTSSRAIVFDRESRIVSMAQKEHRQIYPRAGWVEHDPQEIWETQKETALAALEKAGLTKNDVAAVGIANQRETAVVWNRKTGAPVYNAVVWQDRRTSAFCDRLKNDYAELIRRKTGLEIDAYFSASKIGWILENAAGARASAERGELAFGTVDSWLIWNLTGGEKHLTDASNASRTMLFDIHRLEWDEDLLEIFNIPRSVLPEVASSSEVYGEIKTVAELAGIPIAGCAGDQQAALFGQACLAAGMTKNTYGTGCFMLQNTGARAIESKNRLLTTVAWRIDGETEYAAEGSVFIGGAVVGWLRDALGVIENSADVELSANSVPDNGGVYFVPAFTGLGAPHWRQDTRGTIFGLTRGSTAAHIARAALESIAFQTADLLDAMRADSGIELKELRVDGGAAANRTLLQFQADLLGLPVVRSRVMETTALGAAYLAGLAAGFWQTKREISKAWAADATFEPRMPADEAARLREKWLRAVECAKGWTG